MSISCFSFQQEPLSIPLFCTSTGSTLSFQKLAAADHRPVPLNPVWLLGLKLFFAVIFDIC